MDSNSSLWEAAASIPVSEVSEGNNILCSKRQRMKLDDIRNFDILLPNQKNCSGMIKAENNFYDGFVRYRKFIDKVRPAFMKCNTMEEKFKISKWLIKKVEEQGGRFLKENGDETNDTWTLMTEQDTLKYTMIAFEDEKPWATFASFLEGKKEADQWFTKASLKIDIDGRWKSKALEQRDTKAGSTLSLPQSQRSSKDISEAEISNSEQKSPSKARTAISDNARLSSEPPAKKTKILGTAAMPVGPTTSSNADAKPVDNAEEKASKGAETYNSSLAIQTCLRERQMIREELIESQEILLLRQERVSRIEAEFRLFQNRQLFFPTEQWLTEKILRQEELLENRELSGIQQQRCRRLQTLMELNERQLFEHQAAMEREKLKIETLQSVSKRENPFEIGVREKVMNKVTSSQHAQPKREIGRELIVNSSSNNKNVMTTLEEMRKKKLQRQIVAQEMVDKQVALEVKRNRRAALDNTKKAIEQEIEYRVAMEDAVQRQVGTQKEIEARRFMLARAGLSHHIPKIRTEGASTSIADVKNASPDVANSMGKTDSMKEERPESENEIMIGSDQGIPVNEGEVDESNGEEAEDDDFIVI
mmetsp:Transcript_4545/g.11728  ORF Transcript_4545/g.11728 Transcript_4545/m.11728 type:complete len:591 (-) Transcript_4545:576-2348(-)|eukprot:CAMPEP_0197187814 /NCGR_PEP_ID=MMETSP1423-20130617/16606_1 /TAXON_ID=476441 /ORGANISM="Pseudo-nitzschia heimii, Strain UNC1101" /LENGTH=590 /DNA_ID=CAMNT_0042639483 /DNA_START=17 /DNA_END=1789 /DNA_ORIENTATION=+